MTLITVWEAGVLVFVVVLGSSFGITFGVISHFDNRMRALSAELRSVRSDNEESARNIRFLTQVLRDSGFSVPRAPSVNIESGGGSVNVGGGVAGQDIEKKK